MKQLMTVLIVGSILALTSAAEAQYFTYQGKLVESGLAATGPLDLDFLLFDAPAAGGQIGGTQSLSGFNGFDADGTFVVDLDFGAGAFDGSDRWLEVWVDGAPLSPRQPVYPTPYAMHAMNVADTAVPFIFSGANAVFTGGNVGVGTTSPTNAFHVAGGDGTSIQLGTNPQLLLTKDLSSNKFRIQLAGGGYLGNVLQLGRDDGSHDIAMTGNVGIGTNAPAAQLHIDGSSSSVLGLLIESPGSTTGNVQIGSPAASVGIVGVANNGNRRDIRFTDDGIGLWARNSGSMPIAGNGLFVDDGLGFVGIGTASPSFPLEVETSHDFTVVVGRSTSTTGGGGGYFECNWSGGKGLQGVNTATAGIGIGVLGASDSITGRDFFAAGVGIDYGSSSSRRWKRNIVNIDEPLGKLAQLRGVYFDWDEEHGGHHDVGMIAEEVAAVLPEIVFYDKDGVEVDGLDYSKLSPLLVEAVNALRVETDTQIAAIQREHENEINVLHRRISELELLVERLAASHMKESAP